MRQMKVTVSGSFGRHLEAIQRVVDELKTRGVKVLSPEQPVIVDALDGFVFVASDRHRSVKLVQDRHLASIANSDFLWLETPDGHVGQSAALELGFATAAGIPVYSNSLPADLTIRQYVNLVPNVSAAIALAGSKAAIDDRDISSLLVDPRAATELAIASITKLRDLLMGIRTVQSSTALYSDVSSEQAKAIRYLRLH